MVFQIRNFIRGFHLRSFTKEFSQYNFQLFISLRDRRWLESMFDQLPYGWTQWTRQSSNDPFISLSEGILVGYGTTDKNVPYLAE